MCKSRLTKVNVRSTTTASLALLIPGSRLNARNSPGARPYCNHQPLKKFHRPNETTKNLTRKFYMRIIFLTRKMPDLWYIYTTYIRTCNRLGNFCIGFFHVRNVCAFNFHCMARALIIHHRKNFCVFNFHCLSNW